jgi:hypothetical protein
MGDAARGKRAGMQGLEYSERDMEYDNPRKAIEHDGGILGDPGGYRYATGGRKPDLKGVGEEMLRNRRSGGGSID